jgi:3-oxoadipate enol-lactonase
MFATLRNHRFWYEIHGTSGPPVVLIMGFGISGRAWMPQVEALAKSHRVLIFDNRGIGETESSKTPYGFSDLADDTAALMDHLDWERAHVAGVSMGGMVAQHLALRHSHRLRSLALIATHPGGRLRHTLPWPWGLGLFLRANTARGEKRIRALRRLLYPRSHLKNHDPRGDFAGASLEIFAVPADTTTRLNQIRSILGHDVTGELRRLTVPTLVVRPGRDLLVRPSNSDRLARLIPDAELFRLDDAGHGVTHQKAAELNARLMQHFRAADDQ